MHRSLQKRDARFVLFDLSVEKTSWRGVGLLAAVFFGSLVIAAVLTPSAYWLVEWWHTQTGSANAQWLLDKGIDVYFDRLRMVVIVLGLPWLMSVCRLWSWRELGLSLDAKSRVFFLKNWLLGLILIVGLSLWVGATPLWNGANSVVQVFNWENIITALLAGLLLGFLEETIFRGLILRIFYTAARRPWLALSAMSAFYAYTHFKVPAAVWLHVAPGVRWDTGFFVGFWTTFGITENFDAVQFLVLWLLGMVLGTLTVRTGSLMPAVGLHAGLVSALFFFRGSGLADGWPAAVALGAILLAVIFIKNKRDPAVY